MSEEIDMQIDHWLGRREGETRARVCDMLQAGAVSEGCVCQASDCE